MTTQTGEDTGSAPEPVERSRLAADRIRDLIVRRELLPGVKIGQADLARRIGVSRSPLREALRTLEAEGIVSYEHNKGYVVARLFTDEMAQIYRLRGLLEAEVLRSVPAPTPEQLARLESANAEMATAMRGGDVGAMLAANRCFHFAIFELSPLHVYRREIQRLWQLSEGYRATYLWLPETRRRIVDEHVAIVDALRRHDVEQVVALCTGHRDASERVVVGLLTGP